MFARIYRPARNAMQSGTAKTHLWVLEYTPSEAKAIDPLMGYTGSGDTNTQIKLNFPTSKAAVDYAQKNGIPYQLFAAQDRAQNIRPKGYGANFAHDRKGAWTH